MTSLLISLTIIAVIGIVILYQWVAYSYSKKNLPFHTFMAVLQFIVVIFIAEIMAAVTILFITKFHILPIEALYMISLITKYDILPIEAIINAGILAILSAVLIYFLVIHPFNLRIKRYTSLISNMADNTLDGIITVNEKGIIESFNRAGENMFLYTKHEVEGEHISILIPMISKERANEFQTWVQYSLNTVREGHMRKKNGDIFPVEISLSKMSVDNNTVFIGIIRDISKLKETQADQEQLSHILKAVNQINQLIVRETVPEILLEQACNILIETRDYQLVWIGFLEEGSQRVLPVAEAGIAQHYTDTLKVNWDDSEHDTNPIRQAIKYQRTITKKIDLSEHHSVSEIEILSHYNLQSMCSLPIIDKQRVFGVLSVYSTDVSRFNEQEVAMLEELANDIAFALQNMEDIYRREAAERSLVKNEAKFRKLFEENPDAIFMTNTRGSFIDVNTAWLDLIGYSKEEMIGRSLTDLKILSLAEQVVLHDELINKKGVSNMEFNFLSKDKGYMIGLASAHIVEIGEDKGVLYVIRDITELRKVEKRLQKNEEQFRLISENAADLISIVDKAGNRLYASPSYTTNLGYTEEDLMNISPFDLVHPDDRGKTKQAFEESIRTGICSVLEYKIQDKKGEVKTVESRCSIIRDQRGEIETLIFVARDITERKFQEEMLIHKTYHDELTDLPNRILLKDRLKQAIVSAKRGKHKLAVMFIDLDRFKAINDTMGHSIGDVLLQKVSATILSCLRESDTLARQGGDEFIILLPEVDDINDVMYVTNRIIDSFHEPYTIAGQDIFITASVGISLYPQDGKDDETLIRRADMAMYRAKDAGRAGYQLYSDTMEENIKKLVLENNIRKGLKQEEFVLHYQPQVNLKTGQLHGFEALIRWNHPELGLVLPSNFISLAEESGLIIPVGEWILREACMELKKWQEAGNNDILMMINLSGRQFQQKNLLKNITNIVNEIGIDFKRLEFEITESIAMRDVDFTINTLKEFKKLGINSTIDDFGTGYSSLNYLRKLPVTMLKIDKSFISELPHDRESAVIVSATIALAHSLNLKVIAEGVESVEQLQFLRSQECDYAQGYIFSEAVSPNELESMLKNQRYWEKEYVGKMR